MDILEIVTEFTTKLYKDGKFDILFVVGIGGFMVRLAVAQAKKIIERLDAKDVADASRDKDIEYLKRDIERIGEDCSEGKLNSKHR